MACLTIVLDSGYPGPDRHLVSGMLLALIWVLQLVWIYFQTHDIFSNMSELDKNASELEAAHTLYKFMKWCKPSKNESSN